MPSCELLHDQVRFKTVVTRSVIQITNYVRPERKRLAYPDFSLDDMLSVILLWQGNLHLNESNFLISKTTLLKFSIAICLCAYFHLI